jgi:hypothetical protein
MQFQIFKLLMFVMCLGSAQISFAEAIGPGVYHGYFATDRWGQKVFHTGPYGLFVSDESAKQLAAHTGRPLKLTVSKMNQPRNPGGARIDEISELSVEEDKSGLALEAAHDRVEGSKGAGAKLTFTVRNKSQREVRVAPDTLAIVLVTNSPSDHTPTSYVHPERYAYWRYRYAFVELGPQLRTGPVVACHELKLPWSPQELAAKGKNVRVGERTPTSGQPGYYEPLLIQPDGELPIETTIGQELPPGQYEAFLYQPTGNLSYTPGPMSKRIRVDIR